MLNLHHNEFRLLLLCPLLWFAITLNDVARVNINEIYYAVCKLITILNVMCLTKAALFSYLESIVVT